MKARERGEVNFWNGNSFGFIKPDAFGPDVFFHVSELPDGQEIRRGDRVEYTLSIDPYKPDKIRATQVRFVNDAVIEEREQVEREYQRDEKEKPLADGGAVSADALAEGLRFLGRRS